MGKKKGEGETLCRPRRGRMKGRGERLRCGGEGEKMSSARRSPDRRQASPPVRETGIFCSISVTSSQFTQEVLPILQQAYLDETSRDYFHYSQVTLVNNTRLLNQRNDWLLEMKHKGYTEEELAESFAFLLFDTEDQAKAVCQNGLETGCSDMTTLGNPMKGVYLCKFSDFLHPTPWWHGKQGYILIFKVIKGRVNPVTENYTSDFTSPTPGYNCHISTNSEKVSSKISHFQAFELTQYYLYEFEQCDVQYCPRQIYPFAIVAFRYRDYMCITEQSREIGIDAPKIQAVQYYPWKGKLINKSKAISVALKSNGSALMPVTLPPKLEIEYVIKISELKVKLPPAVFEGKNYMLKEVCLEGLYCSWYELVECLEEGETPQLGPLLNELKEKNLAIVKCLQDQGLLILFSRSFASSARESSKTTQCTAQAVFIFKSPRISHLKDAGQVSQPRQSSPFSAKISPLLPAVNYAVAEGLRTAGIQKAPCNKLVEDHLNKYFIMMPDMPPSSCQTGRKGECSLPPAANATACDGEPPIPRNCRESAISRLSPYLCDPASYILSVSAVLELQAKCLKLCQKTGAKAMSPTRASLSVPSKAAIPLENMEVEEQSPKSLVENTSPRSGRKVRIKKQTKAPVKGPRANVRKASVTNKPGAGKTSNRSASTTKTKSDLVSIRVSSRLAAKVDKPGSDGGNNQTASLSVCQLARPRSAGGNKRPLVVEPAKDKSLEQPAPPEVNAKRTKATKVLCKTGSDQTAKAKKAAGDRWKKKLSQQHSETGVNTEQISWNFVEGECADNASASLQPVCLVVIPNETQSKNCSDEGTGNTQKDTETNVFETDALNILADLAISSAIAAPPKYKQKQSVSLHTASGKDVSKKTGSIKNNRQSNCSVDLCAKSSVCLPGIELSGPEGHQEGAGEHSKSLLASESLRYRSGATLAFPSQEALEVPKSPAQVHEEVAPRSLTAPCGSHALDDHSYSRPPRDRENVYLAVTNPVLSEKEDVVYQPMSVTVESEKKQPTTLELQGWTHPEASSRDEERSYEEGTLVGRVLPFRREDNCWASVQDPDPDPQKENDTIAKHPQIPDDKLTDPVQGKGDEAFQQSHCIHEEKNTLKVTFQWNGPYLYQWDSKYTNDPLEKSVNRALHGLWDPTIQETMKDVKLILHMWIGLFYTKSSAMLQNSIRHVQECTESPEAVEAGDLHRESAGVQDPVPDENDSEPVVSVPQQEPGALESSVIKRIEKNSSLSTSCDCSTPVCEEVLPCASPCSEEECRESDVNETVSESAAQTCKGDLVETVKSFAEDEESGNQEPLDDVSDARSESGSQEHNLDQRSTPLSEERHATETIQYRSVLDDTAEYLLERNEIATIPAINQAEVTQQDALDGSEENWSSSVTTLTCPVLTVDIAGSVDNEGHSATDSDQLAIIRQSSVIRELHCTKPQAQPPSQSIELNSAPASGGCQKLKSKESALNDKGSEYLSDGEKRICEENLQNIEGTLPAERDMLQDRLEHLNPTEADTEIFASTKDVQLHSETSEVNSHDCNRSLDACSPVDATGRAPEKEITGSHVENSAGVESRGETDTQHKRNMVKKIVGEEMISSDSDSEYLNQMERLPSSDEHRNLMKPIPSQNHLEKNDIYQEEETASLNHHYNFDTESEGFNFSCGPSQKAWGSCEEYSSCEEGANSKIHMSAKGFLEDDVPRISHRTSCQPLRRKGIRCRKRDCCPSNTDSDCGSFRVKRGAINDSLQLRHAERNYLAHSFDKDDDECYEMTDSDVYAPVLIKKPNLLSRHQVFQNLSITFQTKPARSCMCERITRTFYNSERKNFHASPPWLLKESGTTCWSSPIQDIIDLEFIHFSQKVKQLLIRSHAAPCTSICSMRHGCRTALWKNNIQRGSSEKKTPFTVTIPHQVTGQHSTRCLCNKTQMPELADRDHCPRNWKYKLQQPHKPESDRMYRKRPGSQSHGISCCINKQMNKRPKNQCPTVEKEFFFVDEQACIMRKKCKELRGEARKRCDSFLTGVSNSFHQNLNEGVKESWKVSCKFYVCETNSDPFFKEVKDFLRKEGHVEISLSDLSMIQPHHSGKVLVIIRNEDIAMHLHQIPYLVRLKRMQCVQFAGVDSPRDIKDQTFQELFSSGGFIVSDGTVLDKVTPEYLQQISAVLEKLDSKSKWKWMVHFRELKRLKEMTREESAARRKISLLNQKVEANIVEFLPFHGCDSKSQTKPDYLSCLMKLQVQRISSRFAVFLSGKPENKEVFTQNGIIVLDINNFVKELRNLTTPLQSTYVTENAIRAKEHHTTETQLGLFFGKSTRSQNSEMDQDVF